MVKSILGTPLAYGKYTYTLASVHLSNTTAKRRGVATSLLSHITETAELNEIDIIGGAFYRSASRECGKPTPSSIEEAWRDTLMASQPDLVPKWCKMEDSRDCCGFMSTKRNVSNRHVARHGSLQNKGG